MTVRKSYDPKPMKDVINSVWQTTHSSPLSNKLSLRSAFNLTLSCLERFYESHLIRLFWRMWKSLLLIKQQWSCLHLARLVRTSENCQTLRAGIRDIWIVCSNWVFILHLTSRNHVFMTVRKSYDPKPTKDVLNCAWQTTHSSLLSNKLPLLSAFNITLSCLEWFYESYLVRLFWRICKRLLLVKQQRYRLHLARLVRTSENCQTLRAGIRNI